MIWTGRPTRWRRPSRTTSRPGLALVMVLAGVVLAPAAEELIFRGVLLGWLTRIALGRGAVAPTSGRLRPRSRWDLEPDLIFGDLDDRCRPGSVSPTERPRSGAIRPGPLARRSPLLLANVVVSIVFAGLHAAVWPTPDPDLLPVPRPGPALSEDRGARRADRPAHDLQRGQHAHHVPHRRPHPPRSPTGAGPVPAPEGDPGRWPLRPFPVAPKRPDRGDRPD